MQPNVCRKDQILEKGFDTGGRMIVTALLEIKG